MEISELATQNPWWTRTDAIDEDPKIKAFLDSSVKWYPRLTRYIDFGKDVVYSVRGPRQIGKTTLVKLLIRKLLREETVSPIDVFYYACDMVHTSDKLYKILEEYHQWNRMISKGRIRIFLDEISATKNWQQALKFFIDRHGNSNITIYLTSSHSLDIEKSTERLPGRTGEKENVSTHKILLPMKFAEYVELRNPAIYKKIKEASLYRSKDRLTGFLHIGEGEEIKSLHALLPLQGELDTLLDEYLLTGGVMFAVDSFIKSRYIPQSIYELYVRQLMGDINRVGRDEQIARQIIASLIKRCGSRTSWLNISKENDIPSPPTTPQYANVLKSMFILNIFNRIDEKQQPKEASEKKVHFTNPFFFHALRSWSLNPAGDPFRIATEFLISPEKKAQLIEGVIGDHLARAAYNLKPTDLFDVSTCVFYWMTHKKNELDFVLKYDGKIYAFDVAYQNAIDSKEYIALRKFGKGCLISKNKYSMSQNIVTIPVSLFLILI